MLKKTLLLLFCCFLAFITLSACSDSPEPPLPDPPEKPADNQEPASSGYYTIEVIPYRIVTPSTGVKATVVWRIT